MSVYPQQTRQRRLVDVADFLGVAVPDGADQAEVVGIAQHSARVRPGALYVARPGTHAHGAGFAQLAAAAGAAAALTDPAGAAPCRAAGLPTLVVPDPASVLGDLSSWILGRPSRAMLTLGVTGTNGKTTTAMLLAAALARSGHRVGTIGTVGAEIDGELVPGDRTTPEAPDLQALLAAMVEQQVSAVAMEVSSHALSLGRVRGTEFDVVGFTNLSHDHLEQHGDMEGYYQAKAALFTPEFSPVAVIDIDDPFGARLAEDAADRGLRVVTVSPSGASGAQWRAGRVEYASGGALGFDVSGPSIDLRLALALPGDFNVANALVAAAMLDVVGVDPASIIGAFAAVRVPGRMQRIGAPESGTTGPLPLAIVDYAHTPDAVATVLRSVRRGQRGPGRVIAVVGCGGDRDTEKRPEMGEAAARGADLVVITDDNPRSEDPAVIRAAIRAGVDRVPPEQRAEVVQEGDRSEAIAIALQSADPTDTVLVLGKGHELGQDIAGVVHPFDDRQVVADALAQWAADRRASEPDDGSRASEPANDGRQSSDQGTVPPEPEPVNGHHTLGSVDGHRAQELGDGDGEPAHVTTLREPGRFTVADVAAVTGGRLVGLTAEAAAELIVSGPVTADSRAAEPGALFVADGAGHDFAADAVNGGAVAVLASRDLPGLPLVLVDRPSGMSADIDGSGVGAGEVVAPDRDPSVLALGRLARAHVTSLTGMRVVAVTGSSGKTGTKDLLAAVLGSAGPAGSTVAPVASLNDELGVPLTALRADTSTRFLVLEMGARGIGHLRYLSGLVRPSVAIVLNVGSAHIGEFGDADAVARAKGELVEALPPDGLAILNVDDPRVRAMADRTAAKAVGVGEADDADVRAVDIALDDRGRPRFRLVTPIGTAEVRLRVVGRHHVGNALAVAATGLAVGMDLDAVAAALSAAERRARWRMEVTDRPDGVTVVNDAYNANPESTRAALLAVRDLAGHRPTWAVLGEMLELGALSVDAHAEIGRFAIELGFDRVVAVGRGADPVLAGARAAVGGPRVSGPRGAGAPGPLLDAVADRQAARELLEAQLRPGDVVLVKSSRDAGLRYLGDELAGFPPPDPAHHPQTKRSLSIASREENSR